jgi:glycine/serine hydroxymethyltransferase
MGTGQMEEIAGWILQVLKSPDHEGVLNDVSSQVTALCQHFPVPAGAIAV